MADPTATQIGNVRLEALGPNGTVADLPDATIVYAWSNGGLGSVLATAARCCEILGSNIAGPVSWASDGQSFNFGQRSLQYRARATELWSRYYGSGAIVMTREVDVDNASATEFTT